MFCKICGIEHNGENDAGHKEYHENFLKYGILTYDKEEELKKKFWNIYKTSKILSVKTNAAHQIFYAWFSRFKRQNREEGVNVDFYSYIISNKKLLHNFNRKVQRKLIDLVKNEGGEF